MTDEAVQEKEKREERNRKRKLIPPFFMLSAAAIVAIYTYFQGYELGRWLVTLFGVMVLFLFLGQAFEWMLEYFEKVNFERAEAERIRLIEEAEEKLRQEAEHVETENFDDADATEQVAAERG